MSRRTEQVQHTGGDWRVAHEVSGLAGIVATLGEDMDGSLYIIRTDHPVPDAELPANAALLTAAPKLLAALRRAEQFIANGVELGYIRMPEPDTPDLAHETLPAIRAAIAAATTYPRGEAS